MPSKSKSKPAPKPVSKERTFLMVAIDPKLRARFAKHADKSGHTMSSLVRVFVEASVTK